MTNYLLVAFNWLHFLIIFLIVSVAVYFVNYKLTVAPPWFRWVFNIIVFIVVIILLVKLFNVPTVVQLSAGRFILAV